MRLFKRIFTPEPEPVQPASKIELLQRRQNKVDRIITHLRKEGDLNNLIRAEITYRHIVNRILFYKKFNSYL